MSDNVNIIKPTRWVVSASEFKRTIEAEICRVDDSNNLVFYSAGELKAMVNSLEWVVVRKLRNQEKDVAQ